MAEKLENLAAEQIVLGAILLAPHSYWQVSDVLSPQHFARAIHQTIYAAIRDLQTEGKKVGLALVESRIGPEYEDGKSTTSYLSALVRDAEDQAAALDGVDDIVDLWRQRKLIELGRAIVQEAEKPEGKSPDLVIKIQQRLEDITLSSQAEPIKWMGEIVQRVVTRSKKTQDTGVSPGFDTGLPSLDEILGRVHGGDLGVCGGRPGDGKTIVGALLARRASLFGPAAYFNLEMKDEAMAAREIAGNTSISVGQIDEGSYDAFQYEELLEAMALLKHSKVAIDDRASLAIEQIYDRCRTIKRRHGLVCCVIDHLRLVRTRVRAHDRFERQEIITGQAKAMAKDLGIAVILLSQVTRASQRRADDPAPQLNDFDGGSSVEQDADWALGLFRRDRWLKNQRPEDPESKEFHEWASDIARSKDRIQIQCLKRRRGADGEKRQFVFDGRAGLLREIER